MRDPRGLVPGIGADYATQLSHQAAPGTGGIRPCEPCPVCKRAAILKMRYHKGSLLHSFVCPSFGHKHFEQALNHHGVLKQLELGKWMPFLYYCVHLSLTKRLLDVRNEVCAAYGNISNCLLYTSPSPRD